MTIESLTVIEWMMGAIVTLASVVAGMFMYGFKSLVQKFDTRDEQIAKIVELLDRRVLVLETEHKNRHCPVK